MHRFTLASLVGASLLVFACSGSTSAPPSDGTSTPVAPEPSTPTAPQDAAPSEDAALPPVVDSGGGDGGGKLDAGPDAAPKPVLPPTPGDPCAKEQEVYSKLCGQCGIRQALCYEGKVTEYSVCQNESPECLVASTTIGQEVTVTRSFSIDSRGKLEGTCPAATLTKVANRSSAFVEIGNPTAKSITASAWASGSNGRLVMAWYDRYMSAGAADAVREACTRGVATSCPAGLACTDTQAGMTQADRLIIPPYGVVTLYVGSYDKTQVIPAQITVRTDTAM